MLPFLAIIALVIISAIFIIGALLALVFMVIGELLGKK